MNATVDHLDTDGDVWVRVDGVHGCYLIISEEFLPFGIRPRVGHRVQVMDAGPGVYDLFDVERLDPLTGV